MQLGVQLFIMGLVKKVVADRMAQMVEPVFQSPELYSTTAAWAAVIAYAVQIYCDFSGYTDMARGTAHLLGYRLAQNFDMPYIATNVSEFWRRWHISLSTWLRDYLFIPLGGSRGGQWHTTRNLMLTMVLGGLWHGASWTFVVWGAYHAVLILAEHAGVEAAVKRLPAFARHVYVLAAVMIGWVLLRSQTLDAALQFFKALAGLNASAVSRRPIVAPEVWLLLVTAAIGCAPVFQAVRRWTVAIDGLILALLMLLFAPFLFAWRCGSMVVTPIVRWWRSSPMRAGGGK
jgi:alginate O-acetyltransferase complex protein AlgI